MPGQGIGNKTMGNLVISLDVCCSYTMPYFYGCMQHCGENSSGMVFNLLQENINNMKKYSIIVAFLMVIGVAFSSCHASGKIGTKHHEVGAGAHIK